MQTIISWQLRINPMWAEAMLCCDSSISNCTCRLAVLFMCLADWLRDTFLLYYALPYYRQTQLLPNASISSTAIVRYCTLCPQVARNVSRDSFWIRLKGVRHSQMQPLKLVNSFSTRLLSSCTDEYAHTYDISTYWVSSDRVS